ncbi:MAG: FAD-dependent oxidoreductase [Dehalococcoidales bacterium]|jgi:fumarate reductase flavoprotein subunit
MKQLETDIAVVAAGTAGLAAAIAAVERGAKVIAFEKASTTGGTGNMAMGPFAVESRMQRVRQIGLTREEAFKIFMEFTHGKADARLISTYINKSADTIDWLEGMGVKFADIQSHNTGFNYTWHIVMTSTGGWGVGSAANMMKILTEKAQEKGVQLYLQTPVKKILKEGGRVTGVAAEDRNGEEIRVKAKAVIIATGGIGDSPQLIKKYTGYELGKDLFSTRVPGLAGDGIRMAWEAGAAPTDIIMHLNYGLPDVADYIEAAVTLQQPNLMVNLQGERFINEDFLSTSPFGGNIITRQKDKCAFMILDENIKKGYEETGLDYLGPAITSIKFEHFDEQIKQAIDHGYKNIFVADSLEELAAKTGIKKDALLRTIDEYNHACETGRDEVFYKDARHLRPIKQPRFYAAKLFSSAYGSLGGIKINYKTEVINKEQEAIPGLYAAGADANTIYSDTYLFYLPGNTFGFAVNSGRMAGENAADYVNSI